jgi:hypothetical protein
VKKTVAAQPYLAITRGLDFIYRTACEPANFETYGYDYLCCFDCIASTSKDADLVRRARKMGRERAREWRRANTRIPRDSNADDLAYLISGSAAAHSLGIRDPSFKQKLMRAASRHRAAEFFGFDPRVEPPPVDLPSECECGFYNSRSRKRCAECRRRLSMMSRYELWMDALVRSYTAKVYGVRLGANFADVLKWLPSMRPYPEYKDSDDVHHYWAIYAVTHVVYVLNGYSRYQLSRHWLPHEYAFLKQNLTKAIELDDPETTGELLDSLKAFGLSNQHPLIKKGIAYLLSCQNEDGSWGDVDAEDMYMRYHPTWTAIDGLRDYAWRGRQLFSHLAGVLQR